MPTLRRQTAGAAGTLTVEFDLGRGLYRILFSTGGFGSSEWANIKFVLSHRGGDTNLDEYFHTGISQPSPGGAHASIVTFKGPKRIDGKDYTFKVVGVANETDTLYAHVDYEEVPE